MEAKEDNELNALRAKTVVGQRLDEMRMRK